MKNTIIYLLGFPGTGKYTIAQEIVKKANFRLVDNHLINNPIFSLIEMDGKTPLSARVWENVQKIAEAVADTLVHIAPPEVSYVLTNHLLEGDEADLRYYESVKSIAEQRRAHFVPVRLILSDIEEHVRRITAPVRKQRYKLINSEVPAKLATQSVMQPSHPHTLTLDVTNLSAVDAANCILSHAQEKHG